ncbi:MAG: carbonic anhydrase [Pseudomonadota bacterium]
MTNTVDQRAPEPVPTAEALVLNCMDHRLLDAVAAYLTGRELNGRYDQITMAGAAIGVMAEPMPDWTGTFFQHVALARKLHGIHKVIVIDHRDCGACKAFVGKDCANDPEKERAVHAMRMEQLADAIKTREPDLEVELLLMDLDGSVEWVGGRPTQSIAV